MSNARRNLDPARGLNVAQASLGSTSVSLVTISGHRRDVRATFQGRRPLHPVQRPLYSVQRPVLGAPLNARAASQSGRAVGLTIGDIFVTPALNGENAITWNETLAGKFDGNGGS